VPATACCLGGSCLDRLGDGIVIRCTVKASRTRPLSVACFGWRLRECRGTVVALAAVAMASAPVSPSKVIELNAAHTMPAVPASTDGTADAEAVDEGTAGVFAVVLPVLLPQAASASRVPSARTVRVTFIQSLPLS
jgi:hypothetical protein